jgi:hypothetical protein
LIEAPDPAVAPVIPPLMVPTVHANVDGALEVSVMFGEVALQIAAVAGFVTTGFGFTVTVIVYGAPTQLPVVDVGVTMYCTVPAVALLGLVSVWLIVVPLPALAPVILPVTVPIVHANVDGALEVSVMFGEVVVQIAVVAGFVTTGEGFTVTVMVNAGPVQLPVEEVGTITYCTVPAVELLGLYNGSLIVWLTPLPALAPVIPPVIVPIDQLNVLGALAVRLSPAPVASQIDFVAAFVITGVGFTVTVIVYGAPAQLPVVDVGVTMY